ncbi:TAT-variant-translocated molybdopterin oxidoreductase [Calidithermus roseus]|uniref:Menaquinone reductase, iron-sulfur cluster-binding subunit n=1 Tax=Calidithermus roseus TaxID=1644118 RepID=A0A399EVG8_9DEIN|nr:TAT-variant-translocated molybdopterin oxidoreductase [Calidithermus roseus]RIH86211.1 Menaquinone reductase, iron-sulfur cluster-binding subunit [Calidithermus roseus]
MREFDVLKGKLEGKRGRAFWRSLEELTGSPEFQQKLADEFPWRVWGLPEVDRRRFLQLMAASLALGGLTACTPISRRKAVPYVKQPPGVVEGGVAFYATAFVQGGFAQGLLAKSYQGRPVKLEGNPTHPSSLGATDAFAQAALLSLYDPDRSKEVQNAGQPSTWAAFFSAFRAELRRQQASRGRGLRILTESVTSPSLEAALRRLMARYPEARWVSYEPVSFEQLYAGTQQLFGRAAWPVYRLEKARVIVALDADFLHAWPGSVAYQRAFAEGRRLVGGRTEMNRLYVAESTVSVTGSAADHRLALRPSQIEALTRDLAVALGVMPGEALLPQQANWVQAVAADLRAQRGASLVLAGPQQPPVVHALAHAMNVALGNVGRTVDYLPPLESNPPQVQGLQTLAEEMRAGQVEALLILGGNPAYTAPADLGFAGLLEQVPFSAQLALHADETAVQVRWHLPEAHFLEAWGDARAHDGTVSLVQPLIEPLYGGKSALEVLSAAFGEVRSGYDLLREHWQGQWGAAGFEGRWRKAVHDGVVEGSAPAPLSLTPRAGWQAALPPYEAREGLEIAFLPDPMLHDGRHAPNAWLQEAPKPMTHLTWDNALLLSPKTAEELGILEEVQMAERQGNPERPVLALTLGERRLEAAAWVVPGHPDGTLTLYLGHGRERAGRLGSGVGVNAYALRTSQAPWFAAGVQVARTGRRYPLASTQNHFTLEGLELLRVEKLEEYKTHAKHQEHLAPTLYPEWPSTPHAWAMVIDTSLCTGCNACVLACQAENNIPVVGKEEVLVGREMHWIRIDRYYEGSAEAVRVHHQPVPCMHCEKAPCEPVCPVAATTHSGEGLNLQVYNRCVGTKYCSNNCPYKVRRFNFYPYAESFIGHGDPEAAHQSPLSLLMNPEVTVRSRGVMEKCTYCVQRIEAARIQASKEGRPLADGEVKTACQQACPAQAIVFGDLEAEGSRVAALRQEPRHFVLLEELNTRPRTTYLGRVLNPNPELPTEGEHGT